MPIERHVTICGHACRIQLSPEANGFNYEVWRVRWGNGSSFEGRVLVCLGWTAGDEQDGGHEAEQHAEREQRFDREAFSQLVADSPDKIRRSDVYRLVSECPAEHRRALTAWLHARRPDLSQKVTLCLVDLAEGVE